MAAEDFNHFDAIADVVPQIISQLVRKAAYDVMAGAQQRARVDTGFMRSSVYVELSDSSTYGNGVFGGGEQLPEIPRAEDETTAYVAVGASYGIYQEMGSRHSPAHPYLVPALEAVRPKFLAALQRLEDAMRG